MKLIVLAAGYATRLYPLTQNTPKPLLPVAGRPMLEHVLDCVGTVGGIDETFIVTNDRFATHFEQWLATQSVGFACRVVNDGSTSNDDRLGAIGDLALVLEQGGVDDDILVVAGDNLFSEPLAGFGEFCREHGTPVLGVYDVGTKEEATKYGVVAVNEVGKLTDFLEKPAEPPSTLIGVALYYYPRATVPTVAEYLAAGNNPDHPGRVVQWLYPREPVHTWRVPGLWLDIGSRETLEEANKLFSQRDLKENS